MTVITASQVKELREKTGVGMMACKDALKKADGNFEEAERFLREKGLASASKKSDRSTNEGRVYVAVSEDRKNAVILELNCETDFVSGNEDFSALGQNIADTLLSNSDIADVEALQDATVNGQPLKTLITDAVLKLGENIVAKRFERFQSEGSVATYVHSNGKIGVAINFDADVSEELGRDIAMHAAASAPEYLNPESVPTERLNAEKEIVAAQLRNEGKPEQIIEKIVEGKIRKYYEEVCLLKQPFVKDQDKKVEEILGNATITAYARYQLG